MTARPIDAETAHRRLLAIRQHIGNNRPVRSAEMLMLVGYVDELLGDLAARSTEKERT